MKINVIVTQGKHITTHPATDRANAETIAAQCKASGIAMDSVEIVETEAYLDENGHLADPTIRKQIIDLRAEAKAHGDHAQADICGQALAGDVDSIEECLSVIADAKARG